MHLFRSTHKNPYQHYTKVVLTLLVATTLNVSVGFNSPVAYAAPEVKPAEQDLNKAIEGLLKDIRNKVTLISNKLIDKQSTEKEETALKALQQELDTLTLKALRSFEGIEDRLVKNKMPAEILQRHRDVVALFEKEVGTLKDNLEDVYNAPSLKQKKKRILKTNAHFERMQKKHTRAPVDPRHNPMRALTPKKNNRPKVHKKDYHAAGLINTPLVHLAAHGSYAFDAVPGAEDPAYLAATPEVTLSQAIQAKAAALNHDPVALFNWVHDRTEWLPTWGAIQNADLALLSQKGNAFDLASLLIALYRASGIPARYVHGTIDVPADRFMNWAGGFTDPNGAQDLVSAAGIPLIAITRGGKITAFRMEHVWVEAAIDFVPSRGAVNKAADTWVALDPSFKQYESEVGYDMHALLNFDGEAHFMAYLTDPADITPYQYYSKQVLDYLNTNIPDWTLIGLYGHERISPIKPTLDQDLRQFAASLPYTLVTRGYAADTIPESLRHKVTVELAPDALAGPDASITLALSELGNDRLTLSYVPASAADDAVVNDYGSLYSAPAYLINVKPQLRQNGAVIATGAGMGLGANQTVTIQFHTPTLTGAPIVNQIKAGSYSALIMQGLSATGERPSLGMQALRIQAGLNEQGQSSLDATFGQLLYNIGALWFWDIQYERDFYATTQQVTYTRLPSQSIVTADLSVHYFFGIPRSVERIFYTMDVDMDVIAAAAQNGDNLRRKDFAQLAGLTGSYWEGGELEGVFRGPDISSVSIIKQATRQNIPIHTIDQSNLGQVLPLLALAPEDINDIRNAVNAGRQVVAPQSEVQIASWKGVGMIALDPDNGQGLYLVSGGLAGGRTCESADNVQGLCSEGNWEKMVATKLRVAEIARQVVVGKAKTLIGTPYGLGCKDPITTTNPEDATKYCKLKVGTGGDPDQPFWIDCSGLVASAYRRIGFPHLAGKVTSAGCCSEYYDAQGQWDYISSVSFGRTPSIPQVGIGDLMFWFGTWTGPTPSFPNRTPRVDHVAIVVKTGTILEEFQWIAAEGNIWQVVHKYGFTDFPPYHQRIEKFHGFGSLFDDR